MSGEEGKRIRIVIEGQDAGASEALHGVGGGLAGILEVAGGIELSKIFDDIVEGVTHLLDAASEEQDIMALMNQGVEHLGDAAAMSTPDMVSLAESLG